MLYCSSGVPKVARILMQFYILICTKGKLLVRFSFQKHMFHGNITKCASSWNILAASRELHREGDLWVSFWSGHCPLDSHHYKRGFPHQSRRLVRCELYEQNCNVWHHGFVFSCFSLFISIFFFFHKKYYTLTVFCDQTLRVNAADSVA